MDTTNPFGEIIGVVGDVREWWIDREPVPTVYYVHSHSTFPRGTESLVPWASPATH